MEALAELARLEVFWHSGWQYLLDLRSRDAAALCYDCTEGATALLLSRLYRHVTVIHASADHLRTIERRLAPEGLDSVDFQVADKAEGFLASSQRRYDVAVLHDPQGHTVRRSASDGDAQAFAGFLAGAHAMLAPGGMVFIGMRNRLDLRRVRAGARDPATRGLLTAGSAKRALAAAGFAAPLAYPLLLEGTRIGEVIPPDGYRPGRGTFTLADRLKELALGKRGSPFLAPGYALVAQKKGAVARASTLACLLRGHEEYGLPIPAGPWQLKRYLVLNWGKVILSLGRGASRYGEYILVLTAEGQPTLRRRHEAQVLKALGSRSLSLRGYLPELLGEFPVDGARCFVMREIPGISIDRPVRPLDQMTAQAVDFIARLHAETGSVARIDQDSYRRLFGDLFGLARARNAPMDAELASLEGAVRSAVTGKDVPVAWLHGDYKIENLIFDDDPAATLRGVLDWEHSQEQGLALIDLLYLLVYNRSLRAPVDLLSALAGFLRDGPDEGERAALARYVVQVPEGAAMRPVLLAMFFVHHMGVRYQYAYGESGIAGRVREVLALLQRAIQSPQAADGAP